MVDSFQRPGATPAQLQRDIWLALTLFASAVLSAALSSVAGLYGEEAAALPWAILTILGIAVPIAFRRRFPITVAIVVCVVYFLSVTFRIPELYVANVAVFIALYTVGAWVNDRRRAFLARAMLIAGMFVWLIVTMFIGATDPNPDVDESLSRAGLFSPYLAYMIIQLIINAAYFGGATYLGNRAYRAALQQLALEARQAELAREREVTAAQAVALDRVRIARELHDVVAHHVSAMGVQAGAARAVLAKDPDAAADALRGIERSARAAIDELHHLLETLRTPESQAPEPGSILSLDRLPELVKHASDVGVPTTFTVVGDPRPVPELAQVNLYRIVQESLTNARRHGGPHVSADVRLRYTDQAVEVEIANTGRVQAGSASGLGQLGMRERAAASGGTIEIGPRSRGGFLVRATIPLTETAVMA